MFFNKDNERVLKQNITQLNNVQLYDEKFSSFRYNLDLDKKISITSKIRWNKYLSFREYLINLVDTNYEKAAAIYELIKSPGVSKKALDQKLGEQRFLITSEKTVGQQIFTQVLSFQAVGMDEKYFSDFKKNVSVLSNPVKKVSSTYTPSMQLEENNTAIRLFDDIDPSLYRRGVYTSSHLSNGIIVLDFPKDIIEYKSPAVLDEEFQSASREIPKLSLIGKVNEWIPLTTLTMNDKVSGFKASFPHKLGYSQTAKQYYVMPLVKAENDTYDVSYKLQVGMKPSIKYVSNRQLNDKEKACLACLRDFQFDDAEKRKTLKSQFSFLSSLESKLIVLQIFFNEFNAKEPPTLSDTCTISALNLMLKGQKGVCRHRAVICREIAEIIDLHSSNAVLNDMHAFCELENYEIDLGGEQRNLLEYTPQLELFFPPPILATALTNPNLFQPSLDILASTCYLQNRLNPIDFQELNKILNNESSNARISEDSLKPD